jgi:alkylation response protein AidB-like acyl-CoA dehydrogenase
VALLTEELGRVAAPCRLLATVGQFAPLLEEFDHVDLLAEVAEGRRSGSVAVAEDHRWDLGSIATTVEVGPDGARLTGHKVAVLAGQWVDSFAVVARERGSGHLGVYLVERSAVATTPSGAVDAALGLADLVLDGTEARIIADAGPTVQATLERALQMSSVALALHTVGACRRIFEMTVDYAKVRVQYDRLIGSFQALKHRFADMYLMVEKANAVGYYAAVAIAEDDPQRAMAAHLAKAIAGDCQRLVAEDGLQLHGGIGYTWENDLHFWLKRAKAAEVLGGSSAHHRAALAHTLGLAPEGTR